MNSTSKSSRVKAQEHRERLRTKAFRLEAHRQSVAVARSSRAHDDQKFINAISSWGDEWLAVSPRAER